MITFAPGVSKTAKVTMRNPTGKAFDYDGVIYTGTNLAVVSQASFHLDAGEQKDISFAVVMPTTPGTYPVYIGVFSGGQSIALYRATEDVVIQAWPLSVTGFMYYTPRGGFPWALGSLMIYGSEVTLIGFTLKNTGTQDVPGVSVKFRVDSTELSPALDPFLNPRSQPFTATTLGDDNAGGAWIWYSFRPSLAHYRAVAEIWVNNQLVDQKAQEFDVQY